MVSISSPIGANRCIVGRGVTCSTRKHAQIALAILCANDVSKLCPANPSPEASLRSGAAQQAYQSNSNLPPRFQELLDANAQMKNRLEQHEKGLLTREASLQTREANLPTREARFEQREKGLLTREASLQTREDKLQTQGGSRQKDEESLNQRPTAAGTGLHSKYV